jgi:hypothetical protein
VTNLVKIAIMPVFPKIDARSVLAIAGWWQHKAEIDDEAPVPKSEYRSLEKEGRLKDLNGIRSHRCACRCC